MTPFTIFFQMEGINTQNTASSLKLHGYFIFKDSKTSLELWFEENGDFRLIFQQETEDKTFVKNEEKGSVFFLFKM